MKPDAESPAIREPANEAEARRDREAKALRDNLARRKAQARARLAGQATPPKDDF